jgi:CBS domain-containing protein
MKLRDVMTPNPHTLGPNATVQEAARLMRDEDTGVVPLVENGRPVGLVTDRDIVVRAVADGTSFDRPVRELATDDLVTAEPEMSTRDAAELMGQHQVRRLLVCEGERLVGVLTDRDIVIRVIAENKDPQSTTVGEVASQDIVTIDPQQNLDEALRLMAQHQVRRLPVVEEDGRLVGIVTVYDFLESSARETV